MDEPLFPTYSAADTRRKELLKQFDDARADLGKKQKAHEGFKGQPKHTHNGCAWEYKTDEY